MKLAGFHTVAALLAAAALSGCESMVPTAPPVTAAMSASGAAQRVDVATLTNGRSLFVNRCAHCHALPVIAEHSAERWPAIVAKMQKRAGLQLEEKEAVLAYILAASRTR